MKNELSERELEVARLIALGLERKEIADRLFISLDTVRSHIIHIIQKLGLSSHRNGSQSVKYLKIALYYLKEHKELLEEVEL